MIEKSLSIGNVQVPRFLYGTAWKENETKRLVTLALQQGFRGIDTANQRRHYHEAMVGEAVQEAIDRGELNREDLFLQTKFTFQPGQDHRLPYDPSAPISVQVEQSFASSLEHLKTDFIDSYILHGPSQRIGLADDDFNAWSAMEAVHLSGQTKLLGVSNVSLEQLTGIYQEANTKPTFVQNRCFATIGWDYEVREFCNANNIIYQGFSLLTANAEALSHPKISELAKKYDGSVCQLIFRFALAVKMIPLTGTTSAQHMQADLEVFQLQLEEEEVKIIENIGLG